MPKLSQANLAHHDASQRRSDEAPIKETAKRFQEEKDPYRKFLVTGRSAYQHSAQAEEDKSGEVHAGKKERGLVAGQYQKFLLIEIGKKA